jgi:hypothetical protein
MVRTLLAALIGLTVTTLAPPAHAFVAEVATSIPTASVDNEAQLQEAIHSVVRTILTQAIAFTPSLMQLQDVKLVGDRIYLLFLIADPDGEEALKTFGAAEPAASD